MHRSYHAEKFLAGLRDFQKENKAELRDFQKENKAELEAFQKENKAGLRDFQKENKAELEAFQKENKAGQASLGKELSTLRTAIIITVVVLAVINKDVQAILLKVASLSVK